METVEMIKELNKSLELTETIRNEFGEIENVSTFTGEDREAIKRKILYLVTKI